MVFRTTWINCLKFRKFRKDWFHRIFRKMNTPSTSDRQCWFCRRFLIFRKFNFWHFLEVAANAATGNKFQICQKMENPALVKFSKYGNPKYSEHSEYSEYSDNTKNQNFQNIFASSKSRDFQNFPNLEAITKAYSFKLSE